MAVVERALRRRRLARGARRFSDPVYPELDLRWLARNGQDLVSAILEGLDREDYELGAHVKVRVHLDKERDLYLCSWPDRILLMRMAEILALRLEPVFPSTLYSFRKGRGPDLAIRELGKHIREHRGRLAFLKRDISSYGDSISQDRLWERLERDTDLGSAPVFSRILRQAIRIRYFEKNPSQSAPKVLEKGVPSGSPLTPVLENFFLVDLDRELSTCLGDTGFYGRYGDDLVFFSTDPGRVRAASQVIDGFCESNELLIKESKKVDGALVGGFEGLKPHASIEWLGIRVDPAGDIGLKFERMKRFRRELKRSIHRASHGLGSLGISESQQALLLKRRLERILSPDDDPEIRRLMLEICNPILLSELDREIVGWIVGSIRRNLRLRGRPAWKMFRGMKLKLLFAQWVGR